MISYHVWNFCKSTPGILQALFRVCLTTDKEIRRNSKSSDFNSESNVKAITTSCETSHLKPPTLPKRLTSSSVLSKGTARSSTKIEKSLGYESVETSEAAASGAKRPSTIRVTDTKSDKTQQEEGVPKFSKLFNAQLFEDYYQRFIRGPQGGAEELDGDDAGSRNSSSEQDASIKEPLTSDSHNSKTNRKHRIGKTSKGQATDSEDDENTRKSPPQTSSEDSRGKAGRAAMYRICSRTADNGKVLDLFHKIPSQAEISKSRIVGIPSHRVTQTIARLPSELV
jgi:hypothetical protein